MSPENPLNPDQLLIQTPIEVIIFPFVSHIMDKSELKCWNEVQLMDKTSLWIAICTFIMYSCSVRQLVNLLTLLLVYLSVHLPIYMSSFWLAKKWACLFFCLSASLLVCPSAFLFVCLHMSASLSVHLFVGLSASLSVCLSACLSICLFVCLSNSLFQPFCLSVSLSASLSVCLSVYLLVCLSVCLSASLSVHLPVFLSIFLSFLWSICPYACQFFSLGSKAYNHHWGHNIYNCSTPSSLDINVSGSEVKTSSIITSITTGGWYNSSTRERKEAKKFEKGKISLYPTANTRKHKITKMCSVLSINQKEYLQQKIWTNTSPKMGINQSIIGDFHMRHNNFIMVINIVYLSKFTYK